MSRRHRLRGRARFAAIRGRGAEARRAGLRVRVLANGLQVSRAGFAIVAAAGSVARNRARRRLREAAGGVLRGLPGYDMVVTVSASGTELPMPELRGALSAAITSAVGRLEAP